MNRREIVKWHREERASLVRQIEAFTSGRIASRHEVDGTMTDTRDEAVARLERRMAELDRFLGALDEQAEPQARQPEKTAG